MSNSYTLHNFELSHPYIYEHTKEITQIENQPSRLRLLMNDGRVMIYDDITHTVYTERELRGESEKTDRPLTDDEWQAEFAYRLNDQLRARLMNQKDLSEKTGISAVTINKYCRGEGMPGIHNLAKIARALKCDANHLIDFL